MKKTITYREITIAIGVLVAMVIALTLWTRLPEKQAPGTNTRSEVNLPPTVDFLFGATIGAFSDEGLISLPVR